MYSRRTSQAPSRAGRGVGRRMLGLAFLGFLLVSAAACTEESSSTVVDRGAATTYIAAAEAPPATYAVTAAPTATYPATTAAAYLPATTTTYGGAAAAAQYEAATASAAMESVIVESEALAAAASDSFAGEVPPPPLPAPSAVTFQDYVQSRFVPTALDNVSTFSLDTDRTSFQLALNWANFGYEVDPDSVRAEEWINAFDYGYDYPARADSFAVSTALVRHPLDGEKHLARIGFQAPELVDDRPLNVTLVLDASGSMHEGNRVTIAREAAEAVRRSLRPQDRIAVVHFTTHVIDHLTVDHRVPDDRDVVWSISMLEPHDNTNVQAGLNRGVELADRVRRQRPDAHNYVILMSDGVANVDATDPFAILETAYDPDARNPLRLITVGVGISNYNDVLLEQLAQYGNGWYRYLNDVESARATFSRSSWLALSVPFADQTRAQVTWDDRVVASWRMIGYENRITSDESFVQDRREFAEIPMGASTTVFFELQLADEARRRPAGPVRLGDVALRWVTPMGGRGNQQAADLVSSPGAEMRDVDPLLQFGAVVALASDRYSSLPYVYADEGRVGSELRVLTEWLRPLGGELGGLASYQDFAFVLDHMTARLPVEPSGGSGYSR